MRKRKPLDDSLASGHSDGGGGGRGGGGGTKGNRGEKQNKVESKTKSKEEKKDQPAKKPGFAFWRKAKGEAAAPPPRLGEKPIPKGQPGCLGGLTFVITGVLESLERETARDLIHEYGGRVTGSLSGKTNFLVAGHEAGEAKLAKARSLARLAIIDEDGLLDLIRKRPAASSSSKTATVTAPVRAPAKKKSSPAVSTTTTIIKSVPLTKKGTLLWSDTYAPTAKSEFVGNSGHLTQMQNYLGKWPLPSRETRRAFLICGPPGTGKTTACHLISALENWKVVEFNASEARGKKSLDLLVHGASGVRTIHEFVPSVPSIRSPSSPSVSSSIFSLSGVRGGLPARSTLRSVIVMDEVDGMSGNSDRGGVKALIHLMQTTIHPIFLIGNDSGNRTIRTLKKYCFSTINWRRPSAPETVPRLLHIAKAERLDLTAGAALKLAEKCRGDLRQMIHSLQLWRTTATSLETEEVKTHLSRGGKDVNRTLWESVGGLFAPLPPPRLYPVAWDHRIDMYFSDPFLVPLFVQHNYLAKATPPPIVLPTSTSSSSSSSSKPKTDSKTSSLEMDASTMESLSRAADSMADADSVKLHESDGTGWLVHASWSSIAPGCHTGPVRSIDFPAFLGKNSTAGKNKRLLRELRDAMYPVSYAPTETLAMEYIEPLRRKIVTALEHKGKDAISDILDFTKHYHWTKDQLDTILNWPVLDTDDGTKTKIYQDVDRSVKSALTRALNRQRKIKRFSQHKKSIKFNVECDVDKSEDEGDPSSREEDKEQEDGDEKSNKSDSEDHAADDDY